MKNPETETLGDRIREVREKLELTGKDFAPKVGLKTPGNVSRYETGRKRPDPEVLKNIAALGGVTLDWLIEGKEPKYRQPKKQKLMAAEQDPNRELLEALRVPMARDLRLRQAVAELLVVYKGTNTEALRSLLGVITMAAGTARGQPRRKKKPAVG